MAGDSPPEERTVYVANITPEVTEDLLEELFLQAGPLVKVITRNVRDSTARFALVEFEDEESVIFAIKVMHGIRLFDREIQVKPRNNTRQEENYRRQRSEIDTIEDVVEEIDGIGGPGSGILEIPEIPGILETPEAAGGF
ncbi:unnamed protein product [Caenorhabditis nigoni]